MTAFIAGLLVILLALGSWNTHGIDLDLRFIAVAIFFLAGVIAEKK